MVTLFPLKWHKGQKTLLFLHCRGPLHMRHPVIELAYIRNQLTFSYKTYCIKESHMDGQLLYTGNNGNTWHMVTFVHNTYSQSWLTAEVYSKIDILSVTFIKKPTFWKGMNLHWLPLESLRMLFYEAKVSILARSIAI